MSHENATHSPVHAAMHWARVPVIGWLLSKLYSGMKLPYVGARIPTEHSISAPEATPSMMGAGATVAFKPGLPAFEGLLVLDMAVVVVVVVGVRAASAASARHVPLAALVSSCRPSLELI